MSMLHSTADIQTNFIGEGTSIWQFCVILSQARIGKNCNINSHVFIENDVVIGDNVTVKSGVQLWDGVHVGDDVFIGPNVTFTNDLVPRSKKYPNSFLRTRIENGASIGANSTIIAGCSIGEYAFIGAGSVVTRNIRPHHFYYGCPARHQGYVTREGVLINLEGYAKNGEFMNIKDFI